MSKIRRLGPTSLLELHMTNPLHEEHDAMVEWCGGNSDPTDFDVTETSLRLQHIKF